MKSSQFFISTLKEAPAEAELASHRLMLRAGLIRRIASGLYAWQPMGLRVLRKVEAIVREEMNRAGAVELLMPVVQPAELWQESGRWEFLLPHEQNPHMLYQSLQEAFAKFFCKTPKELTNFTANIEPMRSVRRCCGKDVGVATILQFQFFP